MRVFSVKAESETESVICNVRGLVEALDDSEPGQRVTVISRDMPEEERESLPGADD